MASNEIQAVEQCVGQEKIFKQREENVRIAHRRSSFTVGWVQNFGTKLEKWSSRSYGVLYHTNCACACEF